MPRIQRVDVSGEVYHVLNRANARVEIFGRVVRESGIEQVLRSVGRSKNGKTESVIIHENGINIFKS